ncbi:MAG: FKBP-type peptidyl-prolyl cis-trans isomerase [Saprospiraceae bacterium]|nr:FKBP-type peptidyl-prolyl cis-trans isomerase [Saprospiraceae bacterium]
MFLFFASVSLAQNLANDNDKVVYSMGVTLADDLKKAGMENFDRKLLMQAIEDYMMGKSAMDATAAKSILTKFKSDMAAKAGTDFLAANAKKPGVISLPNGIQYEILASGPAGGPKPLLTDKVKTHYHGTLIDGKVFDSSVQRGEPISFPLNGVIRGWQEALQLMSVGDKWRIYLPYNMAYGERGAGGSIPPYSALIFEVELLGINEQ